MLFILLTAAACQQTSVVQDESASETGEQPYSELTREETRETLERLRKIRSDLASHQGTRYTGPIRHVWDRILANRQISYEDNLRIEKQATYLLRDRDYITRVSQRAEPFIHFILEEIDKRELPPELALLPVIESAYRPTAISRSRAVGLWQFILPTSRFLGMEKTWWYDARRDAVTSTHYALDYLEMLNKKYDGDWMLALAAYNGGHGRVSKAIEQNRRHGKPTDFWNLKLKAETRDYVPRFLAAVQIYTRPQDYDVRLYAIANEPYFAEVDINRPIDLKQAAHLADMEHDEFKRLNAGFLRWATPPKGNYRILVPRHRIASFEQELAGIPDSQQTKWYKHTVKSGDTLNRIASRYGVPVRTLKETNQLNSSLIKVGANLIIPLGNTSRPTRAGYVTSTRVQDHVDFYTVQPGDTLWSIAKHHGISVRQLLAFNRLNSSTVIKPGQQLRIRAESKDVALNLPASS